MSYNTRNYNTRQSGPGSGRQANYNTSSQFIPASNKPPPTSPANAIEGIPLPHQHRTPRANSITITPSNNDYAQMYNSSQQSNNFQKQELTSQDVNMKVEASGNGVNPAKPSWMKPKLQGVKKIPNKERRRRQNETLRRLLSPKNAVMVLNEVLPGEQIANNIKVEQAPGNYYGSQTFEAEVTVDGQSFRGYGENKLTARSKVAEQAFRDLMLKRMYKYFNQDGSVSGSVDEDSDGGTLPMMQLASFAIHKLFTEWESEGYKVPALRPVNNGHHGGGGGGGPESSSPAPSRSVPRSLPLNAHEMHPCMLLTYMCPRAEYREISTTGVPPNCTFCVAVQVENNTHTAEAKSKKEARRLAAKAACEALYNIQFTSNPIAATPVTAAPTA